MTLVGISLVDIGGEPSPWESGVRSRAISEFKVPLVAGDTLAFETYSSGSTTARCAVSSTERKIGWLVEPTEN